MKSTIVPAQVTTVEDKVAGNLSLSQLILLAAPLFIDSTLYILFPPGLKFVPYKIAVSIIIALIFAVMAIRVKGKILLFWIIVVARYNHRPRYYVFDKNDTYLRNVSSGQPLSEDSATDTAVAMAEDAQHIEIALHELAQMEHMLSDRRATLAIKPVKKGGLHVTLTEVE